jgi:hypothetical protein
VGTPLSEVDDAVLLREYKLSIKRLEGLDPALPKGWRDIRVMYHDYIGRELSRRRLVSLKSDGPEPLHQTR